MNSTPNDEVITLRAALEQIRDIGRTDAPEDAPGLIPLISAMSELAEQALMAHHDRGGYYTWPKS